MAIPDLAPVPDFDFFTLFDMNPKMRTTLARIDVLMIYKRCHKT